MSRNFFLTLFLPLFVIVGVASFLLLEQKPKRQLASVKHHHEHSHGLTHTKKLLFHNSRTNYDKLALLRSNDHKKILARKNNASLSVSFEIIDSYEEGVPFRLRAKVTSNKDISIANYKWILGKNVYVESGAIESTLYNLANGASEDIEVTLLKDFNGLPARAYLQVTYEEGGVKMGSSAYFSSDLYAGNSSGKIAKEKLKDPTQPTFPQDMKVMF